MPVILFACVHNGGRSLAAKVLAQHYGGDRVEVRSAGSEPGDGLNPAVVEVLHERGLSTEGEAPTLLTYDGVKQSDVVVTMGCGETCPVFPGKTYEDWALAGPEGPAGRGGPRDRRGDRPAGAGPAGAGADRLGPKIAGSGLP